MKISSPAFPHNGFIPAKYTCEGEDINPPLEFSEISNKTMTLVLIMDDPDVPKSIRADGLWHHWLIWNMPAETRGIGENSVPSGIIGQNTRGNKAYGGPCPPDRQHSYFFKLYAMDRAIGLPAEAGIEELRKAMYDHVIAKAELIGLYEKENK